MPVIDVSAADYAYQMPDTVNAGPVTIRLHNAGKELHHVQLVRLEAGKTLDDLAKAGPAFPPWAVAAGGPNTPVPGGVSETSLVLAPGNYAVICMIPSPDGKLHLMKGMVKPITVVPGSGPAGELPQGDVTVRLSDYAFEITPELTAGRHVIRVETTSEQPHEILIAKLEPGKTPEDVARWGEKPVGPPPGFPVGGTTALGRGQANLIHVDLAPGDYALLCFIPDAKDGRPHFVHGMMKQIKIS